jgi:1-acyl-sn-glycerol-3-phosphate acyltransferase
LNKEKGTVAFMAKNKKRQKRWVKPRHRFITAVASFFFGPHVRKKYNVEIEKFQNQGKRAYLILLNHQTAYDQFFVGLAFKGPVYYVASEDIFSLGFLSKLMRYAVAPIPIKKQATDVSSVLTCSRVAREGGTIAIAPEGNRTYSGKTEYMNPAIAKLARALKLPIAFFVILHYNE